MASEANNVGWRFLAALPLMAAGAWWICTGLIGKHQVENSRLDEDCQRYIQKALPKILNTWSFDEWQKRATSELQASVNLNRVRRNYLSYRKVFGGVRRIEDPTGHVEIDNSGGVPETVGIYTASVKFEMGNADIAMKLVKRSGGWKFQQYMVRSDMIPSDD